MYLSLRNCLLSDAMKQPPSIAKPNSSTTRSGAFVLLLLAAAILLLFQLFPGIWNELKQLFDFRTWSQREWFIANLLLVIVLVALRFAPFRRAPRSAFQQHLSSAADYPETEQKNEHVSSTEFPKRESS